MELLNNAGERTGKISPIFFLTNNKVLNKTYAGEIVPKIHLEMY